MKKTSVTFLLLFALSITALRAQVVSTNPVTPVHDKAVTVTFDASKGTAGLKDFTGDVYAHAGVITDKSTGDSDWKYVRTQWDENTEETKLTSKGNNLWQLSITPSIRAFYGVPEGEKILKLAFVFRSADSKKEGKDEGGKDILVAVSEDNFNLAITSPQNNSLYKVDDNVTIAATSSEAAKLTLYVDGNLVKEEASASTITHSLSSLNTGTYKVLAVAELGEKIRRDSLNFTVRSETPSVTLPAGMQDGVNYDPNDPTKATLVLFAPDKGYVFAVGDFNNWTVNGDYQMKRDGDRFWLTLEGLTAGKEYAYQYYIDGALYIADPYTEKILDPWNDSYITAATYPNLKPYPTGKATGIVSVLQTAQTPYTWSGKPYTCPAKERLNIYELLVRDFVSSHRYSTIIDSLNYFKQLGINAIELLPTNEFEGNESWGYNPSFYFAPDKYYGTKNELKRLVDSCHANGIAVIIDVVLNHSFGQSPMAQMYWDDANNRPAANSPWFNVTSPNTAYYWGNDFNHESVHTQNFVDRVNRHWLTEYKVDGIRFDFTKGFTQKQGDGWAKDESRIAILKRMTDAIRTHSPEAFIIFEHLTDNSEEKELANYGIMLWGNVSNNAGEAIMGYNENGKSNLSGASYKSKGWSEPSLIAYMESHDEERMMYKAKKWGATNGSYSAKDERIALSRAALSATVFFAIPGPKMMWQFGELGYDYSINACPNGTTDEGCRTSNKAIRWDYFQNEWRRNLYYHYANIFQLRQKYDVFSTTDFSTSLSSAVKTVTLKSADMNVVVIGNFGMTAQNTSLTLPTQGTWHEYFSQSSSSAEELQTLALRAGEYRIYSDQKIDKLGTPLVVDTTPQTTDAPLLYSPTEPLIIYPNPVVNGYAILDMRNVKSSHASQIEVYSLNGTPVATYKLTGEKTSINVGLLPKGVYVVRAGKSVGKMVIRD